MDPETGILYVPSRNTAVAIPLYEPDPALGATMRYTHGAPEDQRLRQLREGQTYQAQMPQGLPLLKPPYSRITAIDMNTGEHVWMVPLGNGDRIRNHPRLRHLNLPPLGDGTIAGPVLTKTLLISSVPTAGSSGGPALVAWNKQTGEIEGTVDLPAGPVGTPMTYMLDGRQYIAVAIGGGPRIVAYALPE